MRATDRVARLHDPLSELLDNFDTFKTTNSTVAARMPLLHQDAGRGPGGGGTDEPLTLMNLLGLDPSLDTSHHLPTEGGGPRDAPRSPEEAHSPRSRVPEDCFPPRFTGSYGSFSESAHPGTGWSDDGRNSGQSITDLVSSLKSLASPSVLPANNAARSLTQASIHLHLSYDNEQSEYPWLSEGPTSGPPAGSLTAESVRLRDKRDRDKERAVLRRASFCGVMSSAPKPSSCVQWSGTLPERRLEAGAALSPKVFVGGLPWETSEQALLHALRHFQPVRVEWPGQTESPRGFAYVTFASERCVRTLLAACRREGNQWFYRLAARHVKTKDAEVIPWTSTDTMWSRGDTAAARLAPARTVFVGALHGMLTAAGLAAVMHDLFGGVLYAGIDTDRNKYPIGSGRVTFDNFQSYVRAISAGHVVIEADKFSKRVQVDPYLEDSMCSVCNLQQGPYFCREPACYRYYCRWCWSWQHAADAHRPLMRLARRARLAPPATTSHPAPTPHAPSDSGSPSWSELESPWPASE